MTSGIHGIYDLRHDQSSHPQSTASSDGITWYSVGNVCHCSRCGNCIFCVYFAIIYQYALGVLACDQQKQTLSLA
jgi:hypothetical protein